MCRTNFILLTLACYAVTACDSTDPGAFDLTVSDSFDIELVFLKPFSSGERAFIETAVAKWDALITDGLGDVRVSAPSNLCPGVDVPSEPGPIDDLRVYVDVQALDGPRETLAEAGPCAVRESDGLPIASVMIVDQDDRLFLELSGHLHVVALHEMAHALGFGGLWVDHGLLAEAPTPAGGFPDVYFRGLRAQIAFDAIGGSDLLVSGVPVENDSIAYPGAVDSHWRESVFGRELMTARFNATETQPISVVTLASLEDLGYRANMSAAESFIILAPPIAPLAAGKRTQLQAGRDVWSGPIAVVDSLGNVVGVRHRRSATANPG